MNIPPPVDGRDRLIAYVEFGNEEAMNAGLEKHAEVLFGSFLVSAISDRVFP